MTKRIVGLIMVMVLLVCTLTACGGSVDPNDPNQGLWTATKAASQGIEMEVGDMFGSGFTIELQSSGKCKLTADGNTANGKWTIDDAGNFTVSGGGIDAKSISWCMDISETITINGDMYEDHYTSAVRP